MFNTDISFSHCFATTVYLTFLAQDFVDFYHWWYKGKTSWYLKRAEKHTNSCLWFYKICTIYGCTIIVTFQFARLCSLVLSISQKFHSLSPSNRRSCMKGRSLEWCSRLSDAATFSQVTVVTLSCCVFSPLLQPCRLSVLSALSQLLLKTNCLPSVFTFTRTTMVILKNM